MHRSRLLLPALFLISVEAALGEDPPAEPVALPDDVTVPENVDHTPGLPEEQRGAALAILNAARAQNRAAQKRWAERRAAERAKTLGQIPIPGRPASTVWLDVLRNPDDYRGQLVTMRGRILSARRIDAGENPYGIDHLYEVTLRPYDSERNPAFAIAAALPEGMPAGDDLNEEGGATGYFFKLREYRGERDDRAAPLILAATIDWEPPQPPDPARLSPAVIGPVRNFTRGILASEDESYYRGLAQARDADLAAQKAAAAGFQARRAAALHANPKTSRQQYSVYVDMFKNSAEVQGHAVTVRGHIRKLKSPPASVNDFGIRALHEAWLYTDKASSNPIVVVCLELPEGMPTPGPNDPVDGISVTGYFFKMYGYEAQDTIRVAPMILAQRLEWTPIAPETFPPWLKSGFLCGAIGILALLILMQVRAFRRDRAIARQRTETGEPISGADLQNLLTESPVSGGGAPTQAGALTDTSFGAADAGSPHPSGESPREGGAGA